MSNITLDPSIKLEGATKMYKDTGDVIKNGSSSYILLDQNEEDTLLQGVIVDSEGNLSKRDYYVVAWGLQKDGTWNQGHYYTTLDAAKKSFKNRSKEKLREGTNLQSFLSQAKENETAKQIVALAAKYGYKARVPYIASWGDVQLSFIPTAQYGPEITNDGEGTKLDLAINNWSYGGCDLKEYEKVVDCCQKALEFCKELMNIDCSTLAREAKVDEEDVD